MGVNNRQRRAAKQRKREQQRSWGRPRSGPRSGPDSGGQAPTDEPTIDAAEAYAETELQIISTVRSLSRQHNDDARPLACAESLLRRVAPIPLVVVALALRNVLAREVDTVTRGGWDQRDLEELVRRHHPRLLPRLGLVLRDELVGIETTDDLAACLQLSAILATTPLLDAAAVAASTAGGASAAEHPKLARIRALLAKAESTEFDEEAEALIGKAQELISRYALGRLLDESTVQDRPSGRTAAVRRLWLDAPYVRAKAALVDEVARANRCRTALAEQHGFCLLVGAVADLDGVELLVTSLLVQANTAMHCHARSRSGRGASRTRSFRQSFLLAYAARIGARLRTETAASDASPRLLPVLRDHEERISEAFNLLVPHTVGRGPSVGNHEGWAAGVAAAELAQLDVRTKLTGS